ncbi:hypothetical protein RRG08_003515 [Elysia crispata]|uniref:Uncharacterized protein n=1 Tax=Elysia crispata TaxID=231223 RepID=A0AAE0Y6E7_9GAST|nr:hypothetical protein RRG08_003515 [Elysia crispata]
METDGSCRVGIPGEYLAVSSEFLSQRNAALAVELTREPLLSVWREDPRLFAVGCAGSRACLGEPPRADVCPVMSSSGYLSLHC